LAFTLLELLVVIAIIAILAVLLMSALPGTRLQSNKAACLSNMRQIGAAFLLYARDHDMDLPSRGGTPDRWPRLLEPYLKDTKVYAAPGLRNHLSAGLDPLSNGSNNTNFIMNGFNDLNALTDPTVVVRLNGVPAPSRTLLLGMQKLGNNNFYMDFAEGYPGNHLTVLDLRAYGDGSSYLFADCHAGFLRAEGQYDPRMWLVNPDYVIPQ
jgi:prepilin-type N-terminal cleavage/methylation domain-containing protein